MIDFITVAEAALKWNISKRRVQKLCDEGRIQGASRLGNLWIIPSSTEKPLDKRLSNPKKNIKTEIRVLVVEDDESIRNSAKAFLEKEGYLVDACEDGEDGCCLFYNNKYNLVILDILLPTMSGMEVLRTIRKESMTIPVLMMTALGDEKNQIDAFNLKVDDYIVKPVYMPVLVKHVEAVLRRIGLLQNEIDIGNGIVLYPEARKAIYELKDLKLTAKEYDLLLLLVQAKGTILTREQIIMHLWGYEVDIDERIIDRHIKNLRDKLPVDMIKTVKGCGYYSEVVL